jgi:hypothetical protein
MSPGETVLQSLPDQVRVVLHAYVSQTSHLFEQRLEALLLYGSAARGEYLSGHSNLNLLFLVSDHDPQVFEKYARLHRRWQREGIVVPLFISKLEWGRTAELFPLEYCDIQDAYLILKGRDPFPAGALDLAQLRVACERELHGNLLRLRQRFIEGKGGAEAAAILIPLSLTSALAALRGLLRALDRPVARTSAAVLEQLKPVFDVDAGPFQEVLKLKQGRITPGPLELPRLFERYHAALEALVLRFDRLLKHPLVS